MEEALQVLDNPDHDHQMLAVSVVGCSRSTVDTSRPFRSVKEAVAIFGERFLVGEVYSSKPFTFPKKETPFFSPSPEVDIEPHSNYTSLTASPRGSTLSDTVKKLEAELEDTKAELNMLKERESETEVALATLNAELHKNMSKLAQAEAATADGAMVIREEEKKRDAYLKMESRPSPSLAQILSIGEKELFVGRKKERKKKPIIPLVGDLFSRKKGTSTTLQNPLYSSSHVQWN